MFETLMTHGAVAVVVLAWAIYRLRPPGQTVAQALKAVVSFGPHPTTPK